MIKNTVAYLMLAMLGFSGLLNAQSFSEAQEKAFAEATVQLLEGLLYVDGEFDSRGIQGLRAHIGNTLAAFNEVGGVLDNQPPSNAARFASLNYNRFELLNTIRFRLEMVKQTFRLLESFLTALERDRRVGPLATGYRDDWREVNDWENEYLYDDQTDSVALDEDGNAVVQYSPPQNVAGHLVERARNALREMLAAMDPVLRGLFEVRRKITVRGFDERGLYEEVFYFDIADLADALFNRVRAAFIPHREENANGVNLRRAVNLALRDLDNWLGVTEQQQQEEGPNLNDGIYTYRFHEGQAEAFAEAMIDFLDWVGRMDSPDSVFEAEALLRELRDVRSRFRNVLRAPTQQEQYEFILGLK